MRKEKIMEKAGYTFLSLRKFYEQKMTPERKIEAFRRYVLKLKRQHRGENANYYDYIRVDTSMFREEALYMKDLDVEYDMHVRITREIHCLEEMTDDQILCYYTLVKRFRKNIVDRVNSIYVKYYILELANLIYHDTPQEACGELFTFWDILNKNKKISNRFTEYFYTICRLFMIAHQELIPKMLPVLEQKSGRDWSGNAFMKMEQGDYQEAAAYIIQNARLLKDEEIRSEEEYIKHTWQAMPYVFRRLEERLAKYGFRHMILNGFFGSVYLDNYPMMEDRTKKKKVVRISKYMYFERQEYTDYWRYWHFLLRESTQDLLNIIHMYVESYMREYFLIKGKRKRSSQRILHKAYTYRAERQQDLAVLKAMLADKEFDAAIHEGVLDYFADKQVVLPKKERRSTVRKNSDDIDYDCRLIPAAIDHERLKKAKADAESVLGMLTEGEIDYDDRDALIYAATREQTIPGKLDTAKQTGTADLSDAPALPAALKPSSAVTWTEEEKTYLGFLQQEDSGAVRDYLRTLQIPENIMVKSINSKALELWGDILLQKEDGQICIIEDYEDEAAAIVQHS